MQKIISRRTNERTNERTKGGNERTKTYLDSRLVEHNARKVGAQTKGGNLCSRAVVQVLADNGFSLLFLVEFLSLRLVWKFLFLNTTLERETADLL